MPDPAGTMVPLPYRVDERQDEAADTVSLVLMPVQEAIAEPLPGQFTMLYAFGVGEAPLSISGRAGTAITQTIHAVGGVTRALHRLRTGDLLGVRGPYGTSWDLPAPEQADLVVIGGGIGIAVLRGVVLHAMQRRTRYRRVSVLVGARTPSDLIFSREYDEWRAAGIDVRVTVDRPEPGWAGHVGVVTTVLDGALPDPARVHAFVCGPEVMTRVAASALVDRGVPAAAIQVCLERNMHCGVALCGHCQLGPLLLCRDGAIVGFDVAGPLLSVKEL
jgi:anaerobic sulfite reductase subunit B